MGWNPFKSEEVTQVGTSISRVIADNAIPDSIKIGQIKALFNEGNITEYVMEELVASMGLRAEKMYRYCDAHYTYGLPSGEVYSSNQGRAQVEQIIETMENRQVFMEYNHYGTLNALHVGWLKLMQMYGYEQGSNELKTLSSQKGTPVYLEDMVVIATPEDVSNTGRVAQWGTAPRAGYTPTRLANDENVIGMVKHSPITSSVYATRTYLRVTYVWQVNGSLQRESMNLFTTPFDLSANYFHAKYLVDGVAKYWIYQNKTGLHPALDNVYTEGPAVSGSYFPFIYFRYGKSSVVNNKSSDAYKTSRRAVKYLGMDFDLVANAIDENPNIGSVENAFMTLAIPPVSSNEVENRYLFDYFDNMRAAMEESGASNVSVIQDARFKMTLANEGITKRLRAGVLGAVDTYYSSFETIEIEQQVQNFDSGVVMTQTVPVTVHRYRHQLSANLYEEIIVRGLRMTYFVYGNYTTVGDETDSILLIPIDLAVSQNYTLQEREVLYTRALHFVFNSRTVTEVKWYQQSWFSTFLIVLAIVITVSTGGSDGGQALAAAMGLEGTAALIAVVIIDVFVVPYLFFQAFRVFVKVAGVEIAQAVALMALLYGGYAVATQGTKALPAAAEMLQLSNGLQKAVLEVRYGDLLDLQKEFNLYAEEKNKELEAAQKLLETETSISPFVIFGEKPEDYFNRTVHYGNIGTLGITAVSSYVDIALTLPKIQDTLGEEIYG